MYFIVRRFAGENPLTQTPELIASAVDIDRKVIVQEQAGAPGQTNIRFSETGDQWSVEPATEAELRDFRFTLPAGIELWANASFANSTAGCFFMVTSVGR